MENTKSDLSILDSYIFKTPCYVYPIYPDHHLCTEVVRYQSQGCKPPCSTHMYTLK